MAAIDASNFSTGDLQGIIAFHKAPAGQRMLEKLPSWRGKPSLSGPGSTSRSARTCARK
jgi:hypothetical protein